MSRDGGPLTGGCFWGEGWLKAHDRAVAQAVCHCADCQRQTGSPFTVFIGVPSEAFEVEGESLRSYATRGDDHGGETEGNFCSNCGAPVFSLSALAPGVTLIKAGSLDDASWLTPMAEVFT